MDPQCRDGGYLCKGMSSRVTAFSAGHGGFGPHRPLPVRLMRPKGVENLRKVRARAYSPGMTEAPASEALERELERLPEVRAVRVVASPSGRILEIHLVTDGTKAPKQLTRDVETVAATQGIDIDRRTISIAQMPESEDKPTEVKPTEGISLASLAVTTEAAHATCRVRVAHRDADAIGEATAAASSTGRARLIAQATIDAVSALDGTKLPADCDNALVVKVGEHSVAVAVLVFVAQDGAQKVTPGVHPVRADDDDAIARAVLDAINRAREA